MDDSKNKKSIGMLIMILALVLVAVILTVVIIASSGNSETTTQDPAATSTPATGTGDPTGTNDPTGTTTPTTTAGPAITVKPAEPVGPTTQTAGDSGKFKVTTSDIKAGLLLDISNVNKYDTGVNGLFTGDHTTSDLDVKNAGFTRISSKFRTIDNKHFLRTEAIEALEAMIQTFDAAAGTNKPFRVEGYTATAGEDLGDAFVTGYVFKIRTYENGNTYGLNYSAFKVSIDGVAVTYDQWLATNAAKYGFVYEGLVGSENSKAGQFRYVGTVHAEGIKAAGSLKNYVAAIKAGTLTSVTVGGETWTLMYREVTAEIEIEVGKGASYTVSGDNVGGVIVAYKAAK